MNHVFEKVYIETPVDTDGDGKYDLIAAFIRRPESTLNCNCSKVPVVFVANPYMMTCNEDWYVPHNVDREVPVYKPQNITEGEVHFDFDKPLIYDGIEERITAGYADTAIVKDDYEFECISDLYAHLNERGYATVFSGGLGTLDSEGFTISGSREEILAFKSIIDWLNGRCRAFTNKTDNIEIKADWCTGAVAMSAKSYLGTLCIGVAATGVEGLKTIIPEAGICNWYTYYRYNGLNVPALGWQGDDLDILAKYCFSRAKDPKDYEKIREAYNKVLKNLEAGEDRESANYNRFWDERNFLNQIEKIKASVFIIHGLNDWNVKTNQCFDLFEALQAHNIERKLLLHQGEHIYVYELIGSKTLELIDAWLDHYLLCIDNGVEKEPRVIVESNLDQLNWLESETWPPEKKAMVKFPTPEKGEGRIIDDINSTVYDRKRDNLVEWRDELVLKEDNSNRLSFTFDPFEEVSLDMVRISGRPLIKFDAAIDKRTAILSAALVDIGEDIRLTSEPIPNTDEPFSFKIEDEPSQYKIITRGWMNAQNRESIISKSEIAPGKRYTYSFEMVPTDYSLKRGHKLALILYGIDAEATQRPDMVTEITIYNESIDFEIPVIF